MNETATIFKKFHDAKDLAGDQAFATKIRDRAVGFRRPDGYDANLPMEELSEETRAFLTLLKIPRRFKDMEQSAGLPTERAHAVLRGLHAAELLEVMEPDKARALIPVEVRKALAEIKGQELVRKKLVANVYRPAMEGEEQSPQANMGSPDELRRAPPREDPAVAARAAEAARKAEEAAKVEAEFKAFKTEVDNAHKALNTQNHFEVLGLQRTAGEAEVKGAYLKLVKKWHPDHFPTFSFADMEEVKKKGQTIFAAVSEANRVLLEKSSRQAYLADLTKREASGGTGSPRRPPVRAEEGKLHSQKGKVFAQKKDYANAESEMKKAVDCDPALAEYKVELAWIHAVNPAHPEADRRREGLEQLRDVVKASPRYADAYYKIGMLLRIMGETEKAELHFRKTLEVDKKHEEAAKEVRVLEMRAERAKKEAEAAKAAHAESKGGMLDMFKKKKPE